MKSILARHRKALSLATISLVAGSTGLLTLSSAAYAGSSKGGNPGNSGNPGFSHSATDIKSVEQRQDNLTTQQSTGFFDQYGSQVNIQNNRTNEPIYSTFGTQRCPRPSLYGEAQHNVDWFSSDRHISSFTVGGHFPLGDGGCNTRVVQTFCLNLLKQGYTTDECDNSGLRKIAEAPEPEVIEPEPEVETVEPLPVPYSPPVESEEAPEPVNGLW